MPDHFGTVARTGVYTPVPGCRVLSHATLELYALDALCKPCHFPCVQIFLDRHTVFTQFAIPLESQLKVSLKNALSSAQALTAV